MVNFGYPYNDLVICKDSTDYLVADHNHVLAHKKPLCKSYAKFKLCIFYYNEYTTILLQSYET